MATRRKARRKSELSSAVKFFAALIIILGFIYLYSGTPQTAQFYTPKTAAPAQTGALPDLIVKDITFGSTNARVGDTIEADITFCNIGNAAAGAFGFTVMDLSENNGFAGSSTGLQAGECRTMQGFWLVKVKGAHTIRVEADESKLVTESDETNNILEKSGLNVL